MPSRHAPLSFLKHAADVAASYGFRPLREAEKRLQAPARAHSFQSASLSCVQHASQFSGVPVLAYWASLSPSHVPARVGESARELGEFGLHIVGVPDSLAEVVLIKTVHTILSEWGAKDVQVRLNALGDKDSKLRFEREALGYLRKHEQHLHQGCRENLGKELFAPYLCQDDLCRSVVESGPRPMNFLSEKSRVHFREFLEHLEHLNLPYEFDDLMLADEREARMLFSFDIGGEDATVVSGAGGRFDDHFRKLSPRKEQSGVSASLFFRRKGLSAQSFRLEPSRLTPSVYFVQLGVKAKLEGLQVSDLLRRAEIPVLQSFDPGRLSPQIDAARQAGVSHLIIMGAREALDRTVLVRTMDNSRQQIVGLTELPRFLKTLR